MNKGEITGLIGPNGAGKSTMLKLMIKKNELIMVKLLLVIMIYFLLKERIIL